MQELESKHEKSRIRSTDPKVEWKEIKYFSFAFSSKYVVNVFYGQLLHSCKNCIACASRWIPACVLVFPLAVMTPVHFACFFCSKEKIASDCYTFQSTILQQQFWNQARKLTYQPSYTPCDYSEWQCRWDRRTSSNKIWICFYNLVDMQPFFDW